MRYSQLLCFFLATTILISCSKKSAAPPPPPPADNDAVGLSTGSLSRIITIDYSATKYKYLWIGQGENYVSRTDIDKTYSFTQLASEKDCKWKVQQASSAVAAAGSGSGTIATMDKQEVIFRSAKNDVQYWGVSKGGDVGGHEEWRLSNFRFDSKPSPVPDYLRFILHKQPDQNGVHAYTIESKYKPGWYLMNTGHTIMTIGVGIFEATSSNPPAVFEFH